MKQRRAWNPDWQTRNQTWNVVSEQETILTNFPICAHWKLDHFHFGGMWFSENLRNSLKPSMTANLPVMSRLTESHPTPAPLVDLPPPIIFLSASRHLTITSWRRKAGLFYWTFHCNRSIVHNNTTIALTFWTSTYDSSHARKWIFLDDFNIPRQQILKRWSRGTTRSYSFTGFEANWKEERWICLTRTVNEETVMQKSDSVI